ncbi:MAG: acetolactate synthase small subunit [Eubacterium sp.]|nr:acetolactate synthase small subunit [Eubacterium sp.]
MKRVLSILVDNTPGMLARAAGLFSRRGYNIDSLTVGETADPRFSRMTVVANGDELVLEQITKQLAKQEDVRDVKVLDPNNSVSRELVLIKIRVSPEQRQNIITLTHEFGGEIVDVSNRSLIIQMINKHKKVDAFLTLLQGNEILELARTGVTGLSRGMDDVRYLD